MELSERKSCDQAMVASKRAYLFGGEEGWKASEWTASDDRVRGGQSQSYLDIDDSSSVACFNGDLDITTLGGAGFASQRTTGQDRSWDLSEYEGLELSVDKADSKKYTFIVKDELLPKKDSREQSTVSYEYDFTVDSEEPSAAKDAKLSIPWAALKPTYRGKPKADAPALNPGSIKRFSIMNRSFFGDQEGKFSLSIKSISAVKMAKADGPALVEARPAGGQSPFLDTGDGHLVDEKSPLMPVSGEELAAVRVDDEQVRHRQRVRLALARALFYSVLVVMAAHAAVLARHGCQYLGSRR